MTDAPNATPPINPPPTTQVVTPEPVKPEPKPKRQHGFSVWRMFFGLLIVLFGLQLLASNYGWNWMLNIDFARLWPVIIVLIGISLLSKGHIINRLVGMVLTLAVIAMVALLIVVKPTGTSREEIRRDITVAKEATAISSRVTLSMGAASVAVHGGSDQAVSGTFTSNFADLTNTSTLDGTEQRIDLTTKNRDTSSWWWFGNMKNTIDLQLNNQLPTDLTIDSGAASLDLDLRTVPTKNLTVDAGASSINLKLGDLVDSNTVVVKSGASSIKVAVPKSVDGVKLHIDAGLSGKTIPSEFKSKGDGLYETDGYADAKKKIDLSIDAGASSIDVIQE